MPINKILKGAGKSDSDIDKGIGALNNPLDKVPPAFKDLILKDEPLSVALSRFKADPSSMHPNAAIQRMVFDRFEKLLEEVGPDFVVKPSGGMAQKPKDMQFIHQTNDEKLRQYIDQGGLPSPSIGVVRDTEPFSGFGDIDLIGKPESFDPAQPDNNVYSADAYTPRGESPFNIFKGEAVDDFFMQFQDAKSRFGVSNKELDAGYPSFEYTADNISIQATPEDATPYGNNFLSNYLRSPEGIAYYLAEVKGISLPPPLKNRDGELTSALNALRHRQLLLDSGTTPFNGEEEFDQWRKDYQKTFQGEQYFRVFDGVEPKNLPYSVDLMAQYMKDQTQALGESNYFGQITNPKNLPQILAAQTENVPMRSLSEVKDVAEGVLLRKNEGSAEIPFLSLSERLGDTFVPQFLRLSGDDPEATGVLMRRVMASDGSENGIESVLSEWKTDFPEFEVMYGPQQVEMFQDFHEKINEVPRTYFEAKPTRAVRLDEFEGAIAPDNTSPELIDDLESRGLRVETYKTNDTKARTRARKKFAEQLFSIGSGVGLGGIIGAQIMSEDEDGAGEGIAGLERNK
tara:strand:+ start:419 stop:2131 length:1713 start_codon:yes stop_codon:yes gene_type:complete